MARINLTPQQRADLENFKRLQAKQKFQQKESFIEQRQKIPKLLSGERKAQLVRELETNKRKSTFQQKQSQEQALSAKKAQLVAIAARRRAIAQAKGYVTSPERSRKIQRGVTRLTGAVLAGNPFGGTRGVTTGRGRGRPRGSLDPRYRQYGGVINYRRIQAQQRLAAQQMGQQQFNELIAKGYNPQEIAQIFQSRQLEQAQNQPQQTVPLTPEEYAAKNLVSENTQRILADVQRVHNISRMNRLNRDRINREKVLVANALDLMKTPNIFKKDADDPTGINIFEEGTILKAPNLFKADPNANNIMKTRRWNLMQTREAGNDLKFF